MSLIYGSGFIFQFRIFHQNCRVCRYGRRDEGVAADGAALSDHRRAAENRRSRIDRHVISDIRMTFRSLNRLAAFRRQASQSDPLVDFYMISYGRRLTDDDTGTVIDEKMFADRGSRMDIDAGLS